MKIIFVNGPPRSGKDTIAEILKKEFPSHTHLEKFAQPLKTAIPLTYGITIDDWKDNLDTPNNKDLRCSQLFDKTPREVQIEFSESFLKPLHGQRIFGQLAVRRIARVNFSWFDSVVISDSGFKEEALEVIREHGRENCCLWRVERQGCSFKGDSRSYLKAEELGIKDYSIRNDHSLDALRTLIIPLYEAITLPRLQTKNEESGEQELESLVDWQGRIALAEGKAYSNWLALEEVSNVKD